MNAQYINAMGCMRLSTSALKNLKSTLDEEERESLINGLREIRTNNLAKIRETRVTFANRPREMRWRIADHLKCAKHANHQLLALRYL